MTTTNTSSTTTMPAVQHRTVDGLNIRYDLPSRSDIGTCVITGDVVLEKVNPTLVPREPVRNTRPRRAAS